MSLICAQNVIDHRSNVKLFIQAERKDSAFLCSFADLVWLEVTYERFSRGSDCGR